MKTAVINFKVDPRIKAAAQKRAKKLGLPLSVFLQQQLQAFAAGDAIRMEFPAEPITPHMEKVLDEMYADPDSHIYSPTFGTSEDAIAWLHDENRKYAD